MMLLVIWVKAFTFLSMLFEMCILYAQYTVASIFNAHYSISK